MKIGILGAGQLAKYLCQAARRTGHKTLVLARTDQDPAVPDTDELVLESIENSIPRLGTCDVVTFENEFVETKKLQEIATLFLPRLETLKTLQDKVSQRRVFEKLDIPVPSWTMIQSPNDLKHLKGKKVLKWSKYGYDGKGNCLWPEDTSKAEIFCREGWAKGSQVYAEEFVPYTAEFSILMAREKNGQCRFLPPVITRQENNVCREAWGPATNFGLPDHISDSANEIIKMVGESLSYVGVLAIEFFLLEDSCVPNEIAPRVHNSGHFSLSRKTSQFDAHIACITGQSCPPLIDEPGLFYMRNLLGRENKASKSRCPATSDDFDIYWYGKTQQRLGRKMGHINLKTSSHFDLHQAKTKAIHLEEEIFRLTVGDKNG